MYLKDMAFRVGCISMSKSLKIALNNGDFLREVL
jgi:hypothetical protein